MGGPHEEQLIEPVLGVQQTTIGKRVFARQIRRQHDTRCHDGLAKSRRPACHRLHHRLEELRACETSRELIRSLDAEALRLEQQFPTLGIK